MKFQLSNGQLLEVRTVNVDRLIPNRWNWIVVDIEDLKETWKYLKDEWFGNRGTTAKVATGIFWTAFISYIFPWFLDIAKVYCAFMVAQGFFKDHQGRSGDGRTGFQSLVHYGKWYLAFFCIPLAVEFIDQVGAKMFADLKTSGGL